jgi:hypothetical protein
MTRAKNKPKAVVPSLHTLMSYRRAHNSPGEKQYVLDHIMPLRPEIIATPANEAMAFFVRIGTSDVMFTSHTDSVHMNTSVIFQDVHFENHNYCKKDNQPLGADDAAGNWIMMHMIHHRVPGVYAFFRGEERGGIGSSYCAESSAPLPWTVRVRSPSSPIRVPAVVAVMNLAAVWQASLAWAMSWMTRASTPTQLNFSVSFPTAPMCRLVT